MADSLRYCRLLGAPSEGDRNPASPLAGMMARRKMSLLMASQIATAHSEKPFSPLQLPDGHVSSATTNSTQQKARMSMYK
jgi:hypothetical protein